MNLFRNQRELRKLSRHPLAIAGFAVLAVFYFVMLLAEFIAPYGYDSGDRELSYVPPSRVHFIYKGHFSLRPFIYPYSYTFNAYAERAYVEDSATPYYLSLFAKGDKVKLWGFIPLSRHLYGVQGMPQKCRYYCLGGDGVGRDLFSRIVYGSRVSLTIGFFGVAITFLLGFLVGGISGYYGGMVDSVLMRFAECFMLVPGFFLMLALRSAFPVKLSSTAVYLLIVVIMSFIEWAGFARIIRGMALSISKQDFVKAAKALGASDLRIITRHVLPQTLSYAIVALTLTIPAYILGESTLSFIGLGIQDPQASWGNLLSAAMNVSDIQYHPWILIPGIFIFLSVMAFNFVGDGLRDALDPNK
ncbi:MAG TPA: ABC transporter permease [Chitinivibrionales bacterium]|nr:ABC transporter permease [Chitinivibrionales bacterium]